MAQIQTLLGRLLVQECYQLAAHLHSLLCTFPDLLHNMVTAGSRSDEVVSTRGLPFS